VKIVIGVEARGEFFLAAESESVYLRGLFDYIAIVDDGA